MGERTSYTPGTFCWTDLGTADPEAAIAFYSGVFGWETFLEPGPAGYTRMRTDGRDVCGIYGVPPQMREVPAWTSWVSVEDADAAVARATELGATAVRETLDIAGLGRSGVIADPQGAVLGLWEPHDFHGAQVVNEAGAMVLNQLNTSDPDAAAAFYTALLGWQIDQVQSDPAPYWGITNQGWLNGGIMGLEPPAPPNWLVYFASEDLDGSDALIVDLGGAVVVPPMDIASGRILVARDPGFAFFALYEGDVDA